MPHGQAHIIITLCRVGERQGSRLFHIHTGGCTVQQNYDSRHSTEVTELGSTACHSHNTTALRKEAVELFTNAIHALAARRGSQIQRLVPRRGSTHADALVPPSTHNTTSYSLRARCGHAQRICRHKFKSSLHSRNITQIPHILAQMRFPACCVLLGEEAHATPCKHDCFPKPSRSLLPSSWSLPHCSTLHRELWLPPPLSSPRLLASARRHVHSCAPPLVARLQKVEE